MAKGKSELSPVHTFNGGIELSQRVIFAQDDDYHRGNVLKLGLGVGSDMIQIQDRDRYHNLHLVSQANVYPDTQANLGYFWKYFKAIRDGES